MLAGETERLRRGEVTPCLSVLFDLDSRLNPERYFTREALANLGWGETPKKVRKQFNLLTRQEQAGWLYPQLRSGGWAMPKHAVMPDHAVWSDRPLTQLRADEEIPNVGKYMFPMGAAKRLDANPLTIQGGFAGSALVFVMEGTLKNDAVLENTDLPVVNVPSVTMWKALVKHQLPNVAWKDPIDEIRFATLSGEEQRDFLERMLKTGLAVAHDPKLTYSAARYVDETPARSRIWLPNTGSSDTGRWRAIREPVADGVWYHDELRDFAERYMLDRPVVIVFDSDWTDPKKGVMQQAEGVLAFLRELGVDCVIAAPPSDKDNKVGIDDWLGTSEEYGPSQPFSEIVVRRRVPQTHRPEREQLMSELRNSGAYKRRDGIENATDILEALQDEANPIGRANWSVDRLVETTGLSDSVVKDHKPKLIRARYIREVDRSVRKLVEGKWATHGPVVELREDLRPEWSETRLGDWLASRAIETA